MRKLVALMLVLGAFSIEAVAQVNPRVKPTPPVATPDSVGDATETKKAPAMSDEFVQAAMESVNAIASSMSGTGIAQEHAVELMHHAMTVKDLEMNSDVRLNESNAITLLGALSLETSLAATKLKKRSSELVGAGIRQGGMAMVEAQTDAEMGNPQDAYSNEIRSDYAACTEQVKEQLRQRKITSLSLTCSAATPASAMQNAETAQPVRRGPCLDCLRVGTLRKSCTTLSALQTPTGAAPKTYEETQRAMQACMCETGQLTGAACKKSPK